MESYKKILVALDVGEEAEQVLQAASDLATSNNAEIAVLHVADYPVMPYGGWPAGSVVICSEAEIRQAAFAELAPMVEKVGIDKSSITIDFGRAIDVVASRATEIGADLIVIGSHGRHGIKLLLGSTANGVLHHAECDVLAVRIKSL